MDEHGGLQRNTWLHVARLQFEFQVFIVKFYHLLLKFNFLIKFPGRACAAPHDLCSKAYDLSPSRVLGRK